MSGFPLPAPPHQLAVGARVRYVVDGINGTVRAVSYDRGRLGLPYCHVEFDGDEGTRWVLMQHLWPEDKAYGLVSGAATRGDA